MSLPLQPKGTRRLGWRSVVAAATVVIVAVTAALLGGHATQDPSLEEGSIPGNRDGTPGRRLP